MNPGAPKQPPLPTLPFGQMNIITSARVEDLARTAGKVFSGNWDLSSRLAARDFRQQSTAINLNGLGLVALSSTTLDVKRDQVPYPTLMLGFAGKVDHLVHGQTYKQIAGNSAVLLSGAPREAHSYNHYGSIQIALDPDRLSTTLGVMLGLPHVENFVQTGIEQDQELALDNPVLKHHQAFVQTFRFLNQFSAQSAVLGKFAIDDILYRLFATLIYPQYFVKSLNNPLHLASQQTLDILCQHLKSRLAESITLTEMERMSGLSARSLQYAFRKQFASTPMQWVRKERLAMARQMLLKPVAHTSIADTALSCGFTNLGNFARVYAQQYGERPSETLQKNRL